MQRVLRTIEINAPVERVFDLFSDFESFPRWMRHIKEVRRTGRRFTRWVAEAPLGTSVEWEAEILLFEPDRHIVWRTVRGDVDTEGEVVFTETPRHTTLLRIMLGYRPPAGRLGEAVARLFGANPERQLAEDLERFAEVAERGGRRRRERRRFERDAPAQSRREYLREQVERRRHPAEARRERTRYDERTTDDLRPGGYHNHASGRRETIDGSGYRAGDTGPEGERRYPEDYVQMAQRYYRAERARDERRRARRRPVGEHPREAREQESLRDERAAHLHLEEERAERWRYAMTPRERELERARRRRSDDEYSSSAFRRGVEKLMNQPPSSDWRRWE